MHPAPTLELLARARRLKWAAETCAARVLFALQGKQHDAALSPDQIGQYQRDGCLLVPGLIPAETVSAAEAAMWQGSGAVRGERDSWGRLGPAPLLLSDRRLVATFTDEVLAAAAQLEGADVAGFRRPARVFTINRVPSAGEWRPHGAHLDFSLAEKRHRTFPRPFRIGAMTYLTTVQPHGGGTIVWPGSHARVEQLARSEPARYEYLAALSADLGRIDLGPPVELTPSRGDVLFFHYLCVHASSENVSDAPRLALNHEW